MAIGSNPRYLEELSIGGGYGDAADGGADFEKTGDISTDGNIVADGDVTVGGNVAATGDLDGDGDVVAGPNISSFTLTPQSASVGGVYSVPNKNVGTLSAVGNSHARLQLEDSGGTANQKILEIKMDGATSSWDRRNNSGTSTTMLSFDHSNNEAKFKGDVAVDGGDIDAGTDGGVRGVVTAWDGSGGSAPGCLKLASPNGTVHYLFVEDDGTLKVHSALPTQNSDGTVVGTQT